ncbi:MAG: hypothetical protein GY827_04245 [Cytophagales bacterium]|nr:hypothetical protein [Cytophagales bacterium]
MDYSHQVLQEFFQYFQRVGFQAELIAPNHTTPFHILVVRLPVLTEYHTHLDFQLYFLPNKFPDFSILQTFSELSGVVNTLHLDEVKKVVRKLNFMATVGSYGVSDNQTIYYKHGNVIPISMPVSEVVKMVDQQMGVLFHQVKTYLEQLLDVSVGKQMNRQVFLGDVDF